MSIYLLLFWTVAGCGLVGLGIGYMIYGDNRYKPATFEKRCTLNGLIVGLIVGLVFAVIWGFTYWIVNKVESDWEEHRQEVIALHQLVNPEFHDKVVYFDIDDDRCYANWGENPTLKRFEIDLKTVVCSAEAEHIPVTRPTAEVPVPG